jgi:hypothetical protein
MRRGLKDNGENLVLVTVDGLKRNISLFMDGLGTFRSFLERKVAPERWWATDFALPHLHASF